VPALIFDYDGVLVDSETLVGELWLDVLAQHDVHLELTAFAPFVGSTDPAVFKAFADYINGLVPHVGLSELEATVIERFRSLEDEQLLMPGVQQLLDAALVHRWAVGGATGKNRDELVRQLRRLGVFERFDAIVTAKEVDRGMPAPDIFLEAARRMDVEPADAYPVPREVYRGLGFRPVNRTRAYVRVTP
jgi:beta-phosphoglucomutase-like phosphatase (HAD superfamily)